MKRLFKNLLAIAIAVLLLIFGGHLYFHLTGDFRIAYLLEAKEVHIHEPKIPKEVKKILTQDFTYLGHGHQTFAFVSSDRQYVLKLFKKDYFRRNGWINFLPPVSVFRDWMLHQGKSKEERKEKLLKGYAIAFAYDKENSGLLYYHPHEMNDKSLRVDLITGLGFQKTVDLGQYIFALQVKVKTTKKELSQLLSQGKIPEAKERICQILDLYFSSYRRGIYDNDHNLLDNTGFYNDRAIRLDIGKIVRNPQLVNAVFVEKDLQKIQDERLGPWLERNYPQYAPELIQMMREDIKTGLNNFSQLK
jgi:hypothetical protein